MQSVIGTGGHFHIQYPDETTVGNRDRRTYSHIQFELEKLHAIKATLSLDKIDPTYVDRTIVFAKRNSATSSEMEITNFDLSSPSPPPSPSLLLLPSHVSARDI